MKLRRCGDLLLFVMLSTVLIAESVDAGVTKLNGELVIGGYVSFDDLQFSPDGSMVLYQATQEIAGDKNIYSVPSSGGTAVKLNGELVAEGDVFHSGNQFSPDGSRVLYIADQDIVDVLEIYSVPSIGGVPVKLNAELVAGGEVENEGLQFSPDGSHVLYNADQDTDDVFEIYSVPSVGGVPVKLNAELVAGGEVDDDALQFSPDGSRVLYRADQDIDDVWEIYSVPSVGGVPVKLNAELVAGGDVGYRGIQFSPDGSMVLYQADQDTVDVGEIYTVPSVGGVPVKLNAELGAGGRVDYEALQFSPDGSRVLYRADQDTENVNEIYSVSSVGGVPVKLNAELVAGGDVNYRGLQFSPDGSRVLYLADQDIDDVCEIYSVPSLGGVPVKLNTELAAGGEVEYRGLQFSPDGSRVLYLAVPDTEGVWEAYSVPSIGGTPVKLNAELVAGGEVDYGGLQFSPDGSRVLYRADQDMDDVWEIYSVPSLGGTPVRVNTDLPPGGDVHYQGLQFSSDGSRVLYRADQDTDDVNEIYTRVVHQKWNVASGQWDGSANWDQGEAPDEVMSINIHPESFATVTGPAGDTTIFSLDIGATDTGVATLDLQPAVTLTVANQVAITNRGALTGSGHLDAQGGLVNDGLMDLDGMTVAGLPIENNGVISGNSTIDNSLTNSAGGEIRAGPDQLLHMTGIGAQANAGRIDVVGNATQAARIEFDGALTNAVTTGNIAASHAVMRFNGSLTNQGSVGISFGTSNVYGDIDNQSGATIVVNGNSNVTFWDDLTNNGTVEVSSGSTVAHFGTLSGEGSFTGSGTNFVEGGLSPGSSPATMSFDGNLVLGASSTTLMELAGTATGEYDRLVVAGELTLGGNLDVELIDSFIPQVDDVFDLFVLDPGVDLQGNFSNINLPLINTGVWDTSGLLTSGSILVVAVPEPSTLLLALFGVAMLPHRRRR